MMIWCWQILWKCSFPINAATTPTEAWLSATDKGKCGRAFTVGGSCSRKGRASAEQTAVLRAHAKKQKQHWATFSKNLHHSVATTLNHCKLTLKCFNKKWRLKNHLCYIVFNTNKWKKLFFINQMYFFWNKYMVEFCLMWMNKVRHVSFLVS